MKQHPGFFFRQQGMALLVSLVVLVVVSILGATAMKLALFQNRISINAQVAQYLFQGAENGLQGVIDLMVAELPEGEHPLSDPDTALARAVNGASVRICLDPGGTPVEGGAINRVSGETFVFTPCNVIAGQRLSLTGVLAPPPPDIAAVAPIEGYDLGGPYGLQQVYSRGYAAINGMRAQASHVQMWGVRGVNTE